MKIHASGEDYLEAILVLQKKIGMVRSVDLARHMGFSKQASAMRWVYCGMEVSLQWIKTDSCI